MKIKSSQFILTTIVLLLVFIYGVELITSVVRGYGFFFEIDRTRIKEPKWVASEELGQLRECLQRYWQYATGKEKEYFPDANTVAKTFELWRLADMQPYKKFNIWVFDSAKHDMTFLYSPLPANSDLPANTIVCCMRAKYEDPAGVYHPYKKFPQFVIKYFGGEKWVYMRLDLASFDYNSNFPPLPGALLIQDQIKYPKSILPSLKAIYPDLLVPPEQIID